MEIKDVIEYYDDYVAEQVKSGVNDRIYHLYRKLIQFGLKNNSNVLELGSGIGANDIFIIQVCKERCDRSS